jgi:uncharacterized protein (DUF58 family)
MILLAALLPLSILGALFQPMTGLAILVFVVFFLAALADAILGWGRTRDIQVSVPDVIRLSKDRPGAIPLLFFNASQVARQILVAPALPDHFRSLHEALPVLLSGATRDSRASWPCTPTSRGRYPLLRCHYQTRSPYGFWDLRGSSLCRTEIRVYPNLSAERRQMAAFFLNRGNFGLHTQRLLGQGREFEKLRDYIPGDDYEDIHWKATAKRGRPITKLYQVERTQEIYLVIDASRLSARTVNGNPVLERYVSAALALGLVAEQQGDLFGIITFDSRIRRFVRASGGKAGFNVCRDSLYTLMPRIVSPDYDEFSSFVRQRLRRRALLLVLTDLSDPVLADSFLQNAELLRRQHLLLVTMIRRPGVRELFIEPRAATPDDVVDRLAGHILWQRLREVEKNLQRLGVGFALAENAELTARLVSQYMNIKARQLL